VGSHIILLYGIVSEKMYFQEIIVKLQEFWVKQGCILLQPYDIEVGAGTSHPATTLRCLDANPWNVVYVQPSRRPSDARYGENPNRTQHYYQLQVLMKPSPENIQEMSLESLAAIGIDMKNNDLRFVEDNWENPTIGAWGLGWEVWCNGMEVLQFTYMQQLGGIELRPVPAEVTYGLERLAMYIQNVDNFWDIKWNKDFTYRDVFYRSEVEYSKYNLELADIDSLNKRFFIYINEGKRLLEANNIMPAYDQCLKASHTFNLLEARGAFSVAERAARIADIRNVVRECCKAWHSLKD
jgi:glycyl-tRNA synthetase alpha chain